MGISLEKSCNKTSMARKGEEQKTTTKKKGEKKT